MKPSDGPRLRTADLTSCPGGRALQAGDWIASYRIEAISGRAGLGRPEAPEFGCVLGSALQSFAVVLHDDRLLPAEPGVRRIARSLYELTDAITARTRLYSSSTFSSSL